MNRPINYKPIIPFEQSTILSRMPLAPLPSIPPTVPKFRFSPLKKIKNNRNINISTEAMGTRGCYRDATLVKNRLSK